MNLVQRRLLLACLIPLFIGFATHAETSEATSEIVEVASVEGITEYQLGNGMRVLLFPDQSKDLNTVNVTYLVGSRHEGYGETGMAHLLEHLVFKGTPDHPNIPDEISERGASANGTTSQDRTNYYETFPATDDNLRWALDLESDRMINSFIKKEDLDSEMTVVRNEWERSDSYVSSVLRQRVQSAAYLWHNYGNTTIGARSDIENVPIERLQAFYRKYYQPDNAVLVVTGKIDVDKTLDLIQQEFGSIPRPDRTGANEIFRGYTQEPAQDGERFVVLRRVGELQYIHMAYHVPAGTHPEYPAIDVAAHVLGNSPSGRLYKNLVEAGLATSVSASAQQNHDPGLFYIAASVRTEDSLEEAETAIKATLEEFLSAPPTNEEVDRAKVAYASSLENMFNNTSRLGVILSEFVAVGDWRSVFLFRDQLAKVTPEEVVNTTKKYLIPSNRTTGHFIPVDDTPERAHVPANDDFVARANSYKSTKVVEMGEEFDPTPSNIDARTETFELSNGSEVAFLVKKTRGATVNLNFAFRHGNEDLLSGHQVISNMVGAMLNRGTLHRSREEITDELNRLQARGGAGGSLFSSSASFQTVRENLPDLIRLIGEILQEPAFVESEFETLKEQMIAGIESQMDEPRTLAITALIRHISPYPTDHPRYAMTLEENLKQVKEITLEDLKEFWQSVYGGANGTLAIVGDFDPDAVRTLLEEVFGDWASPSEYARVPQRYQPVEVLVEDIETPDKTNAFVIGGVDLAMHDEDPDYPAMVMVARMMGGGFLNSRLAERIRQKEGLSYGVNAFFSASSIDEVASFRVQAISAPENADKVVVAMQDEFQKAYESGFTAEELEAAQQGVLDGRKNGRNNDAGLAGSLSNNLFLNRTMRFQADQDAAIESLTFDEVNEVFRRHLDFSKFSIVRGGDFANKLGAGE